MKTIFRLSIVTVVTVAALILSPVSAHAAGEFPVRPAYTGAAAWISHSKKLVQHKLPARQARFRRVFVHRTRSGSMFACGEVRVPQAGKRCAKYRRFMSGGRAEVTFIEGRVRDFRSGWNAYCAG